MKYKLLLLLSVINLCAFDGGHEPKRRRLDNDEKYSLALAAMETDPSKALELFDGISRDTRFNQKAASRQTLVGTYYNLAWLYFSGIGGPLWLGMAECCAEIVISPGYRDTVSAEQSINSRLMLAIIQEGSLRAYDRKDEKRSEESLRLNITAALQYSTDNKGTDPIMRFLVGRARLKLAMKVPIREAITLYQNSYWNHKNHPLKDAILIDDDLTDAKSAILALSKRVNPMEIPPHLRGVDFEVMPISPCMA